jgi:8-oxo-dGTP pyrophosphatase MutT (NUDIX family)
MCHTAGVGTSRAVPPLPAATLVLLRDRPGGGVETLLVQRHLASKFAGGDFAFPGGKIEPDDNPDDAAAWCTGPGVEAAARMLGLGDRAGALGYWIGAIREAFEEVGVLLARGPGGVVPRTDTARFGEYRRACQRDNRAFWAMVHAEGLRLVTDRLTYFAHWITPEERPLRFDTRFFAAEMPCDQEPSPDEHEIIALRWLSPADALAARQRGEISLRLPTMENLALLEAGSSVAEVLRSLSARPVPTIRPRLVIEAGSQRALLPGDPGYH